MRKFAATLADRAVSAQQPQNLPPRGVGDGLEDCCGSLAIDRNHMVTHQCNRLVTGVKKNSNLSPPHLWRAAGSCGRRSVFHRRPVGEIEPEFANRRVRLCLENGQFYFPHRDAGKPVDFSFANSRALGKKFPIAVDLAFDFVFLHVRFVSHCFTDFGRVDLHRAFYVDFQHGPRCAIVRGPIGFIVAVDRLFAAEFPGAVPNICSVDWAMHCEIGSESPIGGGV